MNGRPALSFRPRRLTAFVAVVGMLAITLSPGAATAAQRDPQETFEEVTDVIEVQIPVNVVDRHGRPIRGLGPDAFTVLDRGEPREITQFEVIDLEVLQPTSHARTTIDAMVPAAARRHFLLLFDLSFSSPASLVKARRAAREFVINELHPTDLVAVAAFTLELGPQLIVTFTPDRAQVARAIDTLGLPRLLGEEAELDPLRFVITTPTESDYVSRASLTQDEAEAAKLLQTNIDSALLTYLTVLGKQFSRMQKSFNRGRISTWSSAMEGMAKALRSVEGRKQVVYFSEGFDGRLLLGRGADPSDPDLEADQTHLQFGRHWMVDTDDIYGNTSLQNQVARMLEEFKRSDAVIQAVDISGLGAEFGAARRAAQVGQDALFWVANETGGELYEDANNFGDQLEHVLERSSVTYLLTIQPKGLKLDGEYHELKVKADSLPRNVRVVHRPGYYAPRPFEDLHPLEKSLLASDAIAAAVPNATIDLSVLAAPFRANEDRAYVPVIIEIDGPDLMEGHEEDVLSAEIYTYVSNERGEMRDFFTQMVSLDLSKVEPTLTKSGIKYYGHVDLEPGEYLLRVLVRNAGTGRTGVQSVQVSVPEYGGQEPDLLPPFFFEGPGQWLMVREQRDTSSGSVVYPFTVNGEPFVPAARPKLSAGSDPAELCLIAYNISGGELSLEGRVVSSSGGEVDGGALQLVERTVTGIRGLDRLLAKFNPRGLEPGDYTLEVALHNGDGSSTQLNSIPFSIVN